MLLYETKSYRIIIPARASSKRNLYMKHREDFWCWVSIKTQLLFFFFILLLQLNYNFIVKHKHRDPSKILERQGQLFYYLYLVHPFIALLTVCTQAVIVTSLGKIIMIHFRSNPLQWSHEDNLGPLYEAVSMVNITNFLVKSRDLDIVLNLDP